MLLDDPEEFVPELLEPLDDPEELGLLDDPCEDPAPLELPLELLGLLRCAPEGSVTELVEL